MSNSHPNLSNLKRGTARPTLYSNGCPACSGTGRLHDCENFPLPVWATDYLTGFDRLLTGTLDGQSDPYPTYELVGRYFRPNDPARINGKRIRADFLSDLCSDLADDITRLESDAPLDETIEYVEGHS